MSSNPLLAATVTSMSAALLMVSAGLQKRLIDWRERRPCAVCGLKGNRCRCCR
jgi:hypothetical protein